MVARDERRRDLAGAERRAHVTMIIIYLLPWVLGPLVVVDRERATLFGVEGPRCPSRLVLPEAGCPGCGLTRGTALAVQGHFVEAWAVNATGFLVLVFGLLGALLRGDILVRDRMTHLHLWCSRWGYRAFALAVVLVWISRLCGVA